LQKERQKAREEQEKILQKQKEIALQKKQAIQKIKEEKAKLVAKKKAIRQEQKKQIKEAKEKEEQKYLAVVRTGRHKKYAFMPLFSPTVRMCIDCTNQPRTINAFQSAGIRLHHVHQHKDAKLELSIKKKDQQKAFATLQKLCYNYTITAESGIQTLPRTLFRHLGYVAGALFFAFVLIFSHQFVWKIDIKGNDRVDSQLILRQLKEIGVSVGGGKQQIDPVKVATALRSDPDIAETTVEVKGTTVFVTIVESKQYIPPTASKNPNNITSYYDAVITRMTVKSGTATHKAGDSVAAGEILVKGVRLSSNGELLQKVEAKGEIYGRVTFKDTFVFSQIEKKIVRTGKKKVFTNLKLFSWQIGKKPNSNEQEVSVAKLFLLPIQVERTIVYETITEETPRDIEAYSTELANETLLKYGLSTGENTKTSATLTKLENGFIMVNVYIESEVKIGEN
jgi:similar to stage IV sporulation protein